jgi:hypothetical protein
MNDQPRTVSRPRSRSKWIVGGAAGISVILVVSVYFGVYGFPSQEPWYELGSPGSVNNGGVPLVVGCSSAPRVTGTGWPSAGKTVTLNWDVGGSQNAATLTYPIESNGTFSGNAPMIDPTNDSASYWLLVYDQQYDQNAIQFELIPLASGQSCP